MLSVYGEDLLVPRAQRPSYWTTLVRLRDSLFGLFVATLSYCKPQLRRFSFAGSLTNLGYRLDLGLRRTF
jgi:hypothetical protein